MIGEEREGEGKGKEGGGRGKGERGKGRERVIPVLRAMVFSGTPCQENT